MGLFAESVSRLSVGQISLLGEGEPSCENAAGLLTVMWTRLNDLENSGAPNFLNGTLSTRVV